MKIVEFEDFVASVMGSVDFKKPSFETFCEQTNANNCWDNTIMAKPYDTRSLVFDGDKKAYIQFYYDVCITKFDEFIRFIFDQNIRYKRDLKQDCFFSVPPLAKTYIDWKGDVPDKIKNMVKKKNIVRGMPPEIELFTFEPDNKKQPSKLIKNLFWREIFQDTGTVHNNENIIEILQTMISRCRVPSNLLIPSSFKLIYAHQTLAVPAVQGLMYGTTDKASVFNPHCYSRIIATLIETQKNDLAVYCPVASWSSPAIALHNVDQIKEMVIGDVQKSVLSTSEELFEYLESHISRIFERDVSLKTYCCPTEELPNRTSFIEDYKNHFDLVFFCPPYYDVELYGGSEEQSTTVYDTYAKWLDGYWRGTLEVCLKVLKSGSIFSFAICKENKSYDLSGDMKYIASQYFKFEKTHKINWSGKSSSGVGGKRTTSGIFDDIHILRKL